MCPVQVVLVALEQSAEQYKYCMRKLVRAGPRCSGEVRHGEGGCGEAGAHWQLCSCAQVCIDGQCMRHWPSKQGGTTYPPLYLLRRASPFSLMWMLAACVSSRRRTWGWRAPASSKEARRRVSLQRGSVAGGGCILRGIADVCLQIV